MLDLQAVGNKICRNRKQNNLTQDDLSSMLQVSRQAVSRWEMGLTAPSIDNLIVLKDIFSVSIEDILCLHDAVKFDPENIFDGHVRAFVIRQICEGSLPYRTADIFYQLSNQERMEVLQYMKHHQIPLERDLFVKLTQSERQMITKGGWIQNEAGN